MFFRQISVIGSTMGTREELELLAASRREGSPPGDRETLPLSEARDGFEALLNGEVAGKLVFTV